MRLKAKNYVREPWYVRFARSPVAQVLLAGGILGFDYFTGDAIQFPIAFIIPVVLASWFGAARTSYFIAGALPVARLGFAFLWSSQVWQSPALVNMFIRLAVLLLVAYLTSKAARLTREVKLLKGILPVCSHCKKIRDEENRWHPIERYISQRSDAAFSHGICPECVRIHYPGHRTGTDDA